MRNAKKMYVINFILYIPVSELSFQEGSVYNSDMECTNMEPESQTEPLDTKLVQPLPKSSESPCSLPPPVTSTQLQVNFLYVVNFTNLCIV